MSLRLAARLSLPCPSLVRTLVNRAAQRPVPPLLKRVRALAPLGNIATPEAFLKAIGRSAETKISPASWEELFHTDGPQLRKAGLSVEDRRYILWSVEKFRQGLEPSEFAHPPKPAKKIRGRGPSVQNGKKLRSRRHR
ncbi:IGR protein motif-domain-containing protein [Lenzites betulinus]|nr:IGR protein motif-domain-containing protein [Lenzites betulinus]